MLDKLRGYAVIALNIEVTSNSHYFGADILRNFGADILRRLASGIFVLCLGSDEQFAPLTFKCRFVVDIC
jgi:hypothetical protein